MYCLLDFLDDVDVADFVEELVVELLPLRERQRSDILAASHLYWEWDPKVISDLLDNYITANKAMLYIYSTFYRPPGTEDDNSDEDEEDDDEEGSDEDGSDEDDDSGSNGTDDSKEEAVEISIEQLEKLFGELYSCGAEWKNYCYPPFLLEVKSSIEPHFRTTYWEQTLTKEILESWYNPSLDQSLHLPPINPYIPQNLDLLNETLMEKDNSRAPSKVYAENGISLWYLYDNSFFTPKAEVIIKLASPAKYKDARNSAIGELFCSLVKDSINEQLYLASMAELDVHIHSEDASINIRVSGFNDKICQLAIDCVLTLLRFDQNIINGTCTQETLSRVLEEYTRNCQNRQMKAAKVSTTGRLLALKPTKFSPSELLQVLSNESMSFQSIQSFLQEFRANLCVEILVQGNVNEQESISLAKSISSECQGNSSIEQQIVNLTTESISILSVLVDNPLEKNVGVEIYFQLGSFSVESVSMLDLLDKLISEPVFDTLRTKKQVSDFIVTVRLSITFLLIVELLD